jgi:hypothetical protein
VRLKADLLLDQERVGFCCFCTVAVFAKSWDYIEVIRHFELG